MSRPVIKKTFDCLAFKAQAQARLVEETRGMTPDEEIAYLARKAEEGPLGEWWKAVKRQAGVPAAPQEKKATS